MPPKPRHYYPEYRQREASAIVQSVDRGQSVSVIGPPSIGKSNLLRFLDQARVDGRDPVSPWSRYAPNAAEAGPIVAISIDPNALLPALPDSRGDVAAASWPGFELLAHRTQTEAQLYPSLLISPDDADPAVVKEIARLQMKFENAHPDMTDMEDGLHAHLALRHLESLLEATLQAMNIQGRRLRLAYFMDEFERLLDVMPDYFFVALRSLRDRFKYQVMFVTFTRNSLPYLIGEERLARIEPFEELFHDTTVYMKPFSDEDAWNMIEQLEKRAIAINKDDYALGLLMRATGNFAGLLRAGFQHVEHLAAIRANEYAQAVEQAANRLVAEDNVMAECRTLLRALNPDELSIMFGESPDRPERRAATTRELINKSLMSADARSRSGLKVTPPVLAAYIGNHPTPPAARPTPPPVTNPRITLDETP